MSYRTSVIQNGSITVKIMLPEKIRFKCLFYAENKVVNRLVALYKSNIGS